MRWHDRQADDGEARSTNLHPRRRDPASATKAVLLADAVMFLAALLLGVWKYRQIMTSENHAAHPYVDIAHRPRSSTASPCC